jgi:multiple sugar transport system substrate-binding protein
MKKSAIYAIVLILILTGLLAACGEVNDTEENASSTTETAETTATETPKKDPVKLVMWGGVPETAGPQEAVDNWNAQNPDIQVEYVRFVNDDAGNLKLDAALMSGQNADLYVSYNPTLLDNRIKSGNALDLSSFTDYDIAAKMGPYSEAYKTDGKFYALPTKTNKFFVWINKNALDEAGLEVPKEWTLETLREYAKALTKPGRYGYVAFDWTMNVQMDGVIQNQYDKDGTSQLNNPAVKQSLELYHQMMHVDKSMPELGEQLATKMDVTAMFLKGEAAMLAAGDWIFRSASNLTDFPREFVIATAPFPSLAGYESVFAVEGGLGDAVSINAMSKNTEAAWEFLKWYADGGMTPLIKGGRIPASNTVNAQEAVQTMVQGVENLYDQPSLENTLFVERKQFQNKADKRVQDLRKEEMEKYFLKAQNIDQTIENMVKRHNELLKQ